MPHDIPKVPTQQDYIGLSSFHSFLISHTYSVHIKIHNYRSPGQISLAISRTNFNLLIIP